MSAPPPPSVDLQFADLELAALYDALSPRKERGDFDFYRPLALAAGAVLDVGCGTGSFLRELRQAGHAGRLCGLDPAPGMIAVAQRCEGIEWRQGDLATAGFLAEFDLVVMTGHAFQVLRTDAQIEAFFAAARIALRPGGRLAFETRNPDAQARTHWEADYSAVVAGENGEETTVTCRIERPFDGQEIAFTQTYANSRWPEPRISRSTLRYVAHPILNGLLAAAAFTIEAQYGDWDRSPISADSPEIITLARCG